MAGSAHLLYANLRRKRVRIRFLRAVMRSILPAQLTKHQRRRVAWTMRDARECLTATGAIVYVSRGNLRTYYFDGGKP